MHEHRIITSSSALPIVSNLYLADGLEKSTPSKCKKCEHLDCVSGNHEKDVLQVCKDGWNFMQINLLDTKMSMIYDHKDSISSETLAYESLKNNSKVLKQSEGIVIKLVQDITNQSISFLHDLRTSLALVVSNCEQLIYFSPGSSFPDKLSKASKPLLGLYQSIKLLSDHLELADILSNPDSVTYGERVMSDIYKLLDKRVKLFRPKAFQKRIKIHMRGSTQVNLKLFDSFSLVPLILLDNAVKYTEGERPIYVEVSNDFNYFEFSVESYGHIIADENVNNVFDKGFREEYYRNRGIHGSGLGLYIAKMITEKHGYELLYESRLDDGKIKGDNKFIVKADMDICF